MKEGGLIYWRIQSTKCQDSHHTNLYFIFNCYFKDTVTTNLTTYQHFFVIQIKCQYWDIQFFSYKSGGWTNFYRGWRAPILHFRGSPQKRAHFSDYNSYTFFGVFFLRNPIIHTCKKKKQKTPIQFNTPLFLTNHVNN